MQRVKIWKTNTQYNDSNDLEDLYNEIKSLINKGNAIVQVVPFHVNLDLKQNYPTSAIIIYNEL